MAKKIDVSPFDEPIYVTRPLMPDKNRYFARINEIWGGRWLTNKGPQHDFLEKELKDLLKVPALSLFNNGTIALIVACQSLRVTGDVITTPFTFAATPHVLTWNNARPIFCDIDPITLNINANKIESMITPTTTAILGVHVFGVPCDVDQIQDVADRYGLKVIYDAAHAFNVEVNGVGIGNFGDITMFSFHATKLFHTAEGGALTFRDENLKNRIDLLKNFGIKNEEEVVMPGINGKMTELQAALGLVVLEELDIEREKRCRVREIYDREICSIPGIRIIKDDKSTKQSYQYLPVIIDADEYGCTRDYVYEALKKYNVFSRKYFYPLCSDYTCYRQLPSSSAENLPNANKIAREVLALPFYGDLKESDVVTICNLLKEIGSC